MSKLFKGFFKKGEKGEKGEKEGTANQDTEADHSKAPSEMSLKKETNSIKLGRSDDQHQDLNVLISRPDIVRTISFVKSEQSSRKSHSAVPRPTVEGNISAFSGVVDRVQTLPRRLLTLHEADCAYDIRPRNQNVEVLMLIIASAQLDAIGFFL
eukprot:CAMPEP_0173357116 /NCGR_PEP_ID=MMETSP1144-20121109/18691_1 /TAXON_ID=483371 /ORGANISM="non described non described, Strain CCMP2298" /LENGTH=153 /DNA_ID=CAMNT_0014305999 /DNA_START=974 /DNA_END=1436 /DNA_ORIENTATION=-